MELVSFEDAAERLGVGVGSVRQYTQPSYHEKHGVTLVKHPDGGGVTLASLEAYEARRVVSKRGRAGRDPVLAGQVARRNVEGVPGLAGVLSDGGEAVSGEGEVSGSVGGDVGVGAGEGEGSLEVAGREDVLVPGVQGVAFDGAAEAESLGDGHDPFDGDESLLQCGCGLAASWWWDPQSRSGKLTPGSGRVPFCGHHGPNTPPVEQPSAGALGHAEGSLERVEVELPPVAEWTEDDVLTDADPSRELWPSTPLEQRRRIMLDQQREILFGVDVSGEKPSGLIDFLKQEVSEDGPALTEEQFDAGLRHLGFSASSPEGWPEVDDDVLEDCEVVQGPPEKHSELTAVPSDAPWDELRMRASRAMGWMEGVVAGAFSEDRNPPGEIVEVALSHLEDVLVDAGLLVERRA